ncbi:SPOR domain-containing protein [uncultured Bacteroides sp.]|uniref:HU domain-containing protein n=1 Tax=uncultured Bacteroides sp. TaxID=162156 RepID=UPI002AA7BDD1|nr:SPOR domain-containing protein [uncultured Bacteroides sp.]
MIELAQHIEALLLENDCVIVPGFGGFVAHYASAKWIAEEYTFLPPTRTIGFNPQLKMNDGLLVQSYMATYDTDFSDASKIIDKKAEELFSLLHEDGKVDLANIGELHFTIHDTYEFIPYDNKITTPSLYGLDVLEIKPLTVLQNHSIKKVSSPFVPVEKKTYNIRINRSFLRHAVATAAAIALFLFTSTPMENTYVETDNYAQLLPSDLFEKIEKQSVAVTSIAVNSADKNIEKSAERARKMRAVEEIKKPDAGSIPETNTKTTLPADLVAPKPTKQIVEENSKVYHIIVASSIRSEAAKTLAKELRAQGYPTAKALLDTDKVRVSILSCPTREEAGKQLTKIRQNKTCENAWVLAAAK